MRFLGSLIVILFSLLLPFGGARAQSNPDLASAEVRIWPEYDRAEALVITTATLSSSVSLPAQVNFRIPKESGRPYAVAMEDVDGSLINLNYSVSEQGEWVVINFTMQSPATVFHIEYYDPRFLKEGTIRNYQFEWNGDFNVGSLTVQIQQPIGASELKISPNLNMASGTNENGLTVYTYEVGQLNQGTDFAFQFSYKKLDDTLTAQSQPVEPSDPIDQTTAGRRSIQQVWPWVAGGLGLLLVTGGSIWFWLAGKERKTRPARRRHHGRSHASEGVEPSSDIYCHQCGKRANSGDLFCRTCGTKLRL